VCRATGGQERGRLFVGFAAVRMAETMLREELMVVENWERRLDREIRISRNGTEKLHLDLLSAISGCKARLAAPRLRAWA